jgi:hypothetical protein
VDIDTKTWLADLVDRTLETYDPAAAMMRLPPELRTEDPDGPSIEARARTLMVRSLRRGKLLDTPGAEAPDAFLGPVQGHIGLALDVALLHHGPPFTPPRRKAEIAALLAAMTGAIDLARRADPGRSGHGGPAAVKKALVHAGAELKARGHPAGDPKDGLPMRAGLLCIERRQLARLAIGYYGQGALELAAARRILDQAYAETALLTEVLAALASAPAPLDPHRRRIALAQVTRLRLPRELARRTREAVRAPRAVSSLARAAPERLRAFLLEQLLVSELASAQGAPARTEFVEAFAIEAKIPPEHVTALQADAAELHREQQRWLEPGPTGTPEDWETLSEEWEDVADQMMEKVAAAVTDNLEAIVTEIKQTGELGQLVAKAAAGKRLTAEEKRKVKAQLIDLAKAVPALAIFAAPGGMLLLPLLAKLLPFNVLPSAWDEKERAKKAGS